MNKYNFYRCAFTLAFCFGLGSMAVAQQKVREDPISTVEKNFRLIPDQQKLAVYWYWMSDNISKEGVVKDLNAMKKAGINRAYLGNIGTSEIPYGKVKIFTDEWWDIIHTALKTASDLNIEIGIFNCPGWSQSGGPWIKPSQAMRYLGSSQVKVKGPLKYNKKLPEVGKDEQDVRVIAFPDIESTASFMPRQKLNETNVIDFV